MPWELLRLPAGPGAAAHHLAASDKTPFSRYLALPSPSSSQIVDERLRVLVAIADPDNLAKYDLTPDHRAVELETLQAAVAGLPVELTELTGPCTLPAIERAPAPGLPRPALRRSRRVRGKRRCGPVLGRRCQPGQDHTRGGDGSHAGPPGRAEQPAATSLPGQLPDRRRQPGRRLSRPGAAIAPCRHLCRAGHAGPGAGADLPRLRPDLLSPALAHGAVDLAADQARPCR